MKRIILIFCITFFTAGIGHTQPGSEFLEIYDSLTNTVSKIAVSDDLTVLEGQAPASVNQTPEDWTAATAFHGGNWFQDEGFRYPFAAIVYLDIGGKSCSGAMVGPYTVLTAAHCVYKDVHHNRGHLHTPNQVTAYVGGKNGSGRIAKGNRIYAAKGTEGRSWDSEFIKRDYAIIVLNKSIGTQSGSLGVHKANFKKGDPMFLMGFPGKLNKKGPWISRGNITGIGQGFVAFNADTLPGSSGSPIFEGGNYSIAGVNSFEDATQNGAVVSADSALLSFVKKYRNEKPTTNTPKHRASAAQSQPNTQQEIHALIHQLKYK